MPSTHTKEFDEQCRSNVDTRQMVNEIMSDKGLHCLPKWYNNFSKMINVTAVNKTKDPIVTDRSVSLNDNSSRHAHKWINRSTLFHN